MKRAATFGNGWYGSPEAINELEQLRADAGRADQQFEYSTITLQGPVPLDQLEAMAGLGVHRVVVTPWPDTKVGEVGREGLADLERYARQIGLP
jgi:hypothetical protein